GARADSTAATGRPQAYARRHAQTHAPALARRPANHPSPRRLRHSLYPQSLRARLGCHTRWQHTAQPLRSRLGPGPRRILTTRGTVGISATGHLNSTTLRDLLKAIPDGTWELVCHPGYNDSDLDAITTRLRTERETELRTLLAFPKSLLPSMNPSGLRLIHYGELDSWFVS